MRKLALFFVLFFTPLLASADDFLAEVVQLKGQATYSLPGAEERELTLARRLPSGALVKTAQSSFVKLRLADGSSVGVAPESTMSLRLRQSSVSMLGLVEGQIRAAVEKAANPEGEKLIVVTKNASMGIRGTEFVVGYDSVSEDTSLVTLKGKVAFARLEPGQAPELALKNRPVMVAAGESSGLSREEKSPRKPEPLEKNQREKLEREDFWQGMSRKNGSAATSRTKSGLRENGAKEEPEEEEVTHKSAKAKDKKKKKVVR
jgi:FecR protein